MYVPIVTQNINEVTANIDIFLLAKFLQNSCKKAVAVQRPLSETLGQWGIKSEIEYEQKNSASSWEAEWNNCFAFALIHDPEKDAWEEEGNLHDDGDGKEDGEGDDVLFSSCCALVEEREDKA